jgi:nucleoside-diphosphate-sugar epimerase
MTARVAVIGANGQVASEVTLLLKQLGQDVVPVVRGRMGASFLRYMGVAVRIGSLAEEAQGASLLRDADIVANFALAGGTGKEMRQANDALIRNSFRHSPAHACLLFFSTLAVNDGFNADASKRGAYGREKLRNERLFARLAREGNRRALVLRLGHVCGEHQSISAAMRELIALKPVRLPDPERHANCISTAGIADVIIGLAEGRVEASGRYDLVNDPSWSWRQVLAHEARRIGYPLSIAVEPDSLRSPRPLKRLAAGLVRSAFASPAIKSRADRLLPLLPRSAGEAVKTRYFRQRAAEEIARLAEPDVLEAAQYPGWEAQVPPGLTPTATLLEDPRYIAPVRPIASSWPVDI